MKHNYPEMPKHTLPAHFGELAIWTTGPRHFGMTIDGLEVNRVAYDVRIDAAPLAGWPDSNDLRERPAWEANGYGATYSNLRLRRSDVAFDLENGTDSARRKVADMILGYFGEWMSTDDGREFTRQAHEYGARYDANRAEEALNKARAAVAEATKALKDAEKRIARAVGQ